MARKCLAVLGAFLAVMSTVGSHCNNNRGITEPPGLTQIPTATQTPTGPTNTPGPPTATSTNTPIPPSATRTPLPSTPTNTPIPSSPTRTATAGPGTATPTPTPPSGAPVVTSADATQVSDNTTFDIFGSNLGPCSQIKVEFELPPPTGGPTYLLTCLFGDGQSVQVRVPLGIPPGNYVLCVEEGPLKGCSSFTVKKQ